MKIIADSAIPFLQGVPEPWAEVKYIPGASISPGDVRDADALIVRTRTRCDANLLAGSRVKLIATATIGFDHIDIPWCESQGIRVETAAGCNARGVLQWIGAALAHLSTAQGWQPAERTLGIVGVGHVGSLVREYAEAWGFSVVCCDPPREEREHCGFSPLDDVLRKADILTLHTPLNDTTRHLIGKAQLELMRPGATLINTSRGEVVDTDALRHSQHPFALDVWEHEPKIDPELLRRALLSTPHIAGYSEQGKAMATAMSVRAIARTFGLPLQEWYPPQAAPSSPRPIAWQELCTSIGSAFDIVSQSRLLKSQPDGFEQIRDNYNYRREYF